MATPAITTYGLSKRYASSRNFALRDLELSINPGEVYGFLGPNGAGKSTTIRLLMNFIAPTRGEARILGFDTLTQSVDIKQHVGYVPGEPALYPKMTGQQQLVYLSELRPPPRPNYTHHLTRLFKADLKTRIRNLSRGNRQKIALIQAFMHEPKILILDEPTSGLDPLMQEIFFDLVRQTKNRGATVFLSSHNLNEVQKICDRIGFIREGRLIAEQAIDDMTKSTFQTYDIAFGQTVPSRELRAVPGLKLTTNSSHHATIRIKGDLRPLFRVLAKSSVRSIERQEISLEEQFMKFYRGRR